jgi:hypothetical protein
MDSRDLPHTYHQRLHLPDYDAKLSAPDSRTLHTGEADSLSQVWGRERLRAAMDWSGIDQVPVDLLVWGRGAPIHPADTKIGGMPVWPAGRPLPREERNDWETPTQLRFFAQVNFADSRDLLPELPGPMLSIWGTEDFPYGENPMQTFWLDLEDLELAVDYAPDFSWDFMPQVRFFAALHRSWDRSHPQELRDEAEGQEGRKTDFCATSWMASKIGGQAVRIQNEADLADTQFFLQIKSINPAVQFPHAWVSEPEPFQVGPSLRKLIEDDGRLSLSDGGTLSFFVNAWGAVETVFEYC